MDHKLPGEDAVLDILIDGPEDQVVLESLSALLWLCLLNFLLRLSLFEISVRVGGSLFWRVFLG